MTRLYWSLAVILALLVSVYAGNRITTNLHHPAAVTSATSTGLGAIHSQTFPPIVLPTSSTTPAAVTPKPEATTTQHTAPRTPSAPTTPTSPSTAQQSTQPKTPAPTQTQSTPPASSVSVAVQLDVAANKLRAALVNIVCYAPAGSNLHSISGSGIIVDSKGIILTNAHVAQYFLLHDKGVACAIRAGSPAADAYLAKLIYIPAAWVSANASVLTQSQPTGTGEDDFAFLAITKSDTSTPLPTTFPFVPLATTAPKPGDPVAIASFGAQFLQTSQIQNALFPTVVFGSVKQVFTFNKNTIDVLDLGGSAAAQEGSSGGGVANAAGNLIATITTSTVTGATDTRTLSAITETYIRRAFEAETQSTLSTLLAQPVQVSVSNFSPKIPKLEAILTAQLAH